jgi:flagellar motor switch protein FliG
MSQAAAPREQTGAEQVALFLLSLDEAEAASVMKHLSADIVADVATAMTKLPPDAVESSLQERVWLALNEAATKPEPLRIPARNELGDLLTRALGKESAADVLRMMEDRRLQERPFADLEACAPEIVARVLHSESPAATALVLAHFEPALSSAVLSGFESAAALEIVRGMADVVPPPFALLRGIAADLTARAEVLASEPVKVEPSQRLRTIAEMLGRVTGGLDKAVLDKLRESNADMAKEVQEFMFTWDDLVKVDKRGMQKILGAINTTTLATAIKGSNKAVEENVLGNMSARARKMVQEERELAGAVPMAQVTVARNEILTTVRALIESGEFRPAGGSAEELVS